MFGDMETNMLVWDQTGAFKASWNGFGQHGSIRAEPGHGETSKDGKGVSLPSTSNLMTPLVLMKVTLYWDPTSHAGVIIHKDEPSLAVSVAITVCQAENVVEEYLQDGLLSSQHDAVGFSWTHCAHIWLLGSKHQLSQRL